MQHKSLEVKPLDAWYEVERYSEKYSNWFSVGGSFYFPRRFNNLADVLAFKGSTDALYEDKGRVILVTKVVI